MQEDSAVAAASDNQADDMMMPDQSASGDPAAGDPAAGDPAASDPAAGDPAASDPAAGDPAAGAQGDDMMAQDDIEAAREAMEQAGNDLQRAGEMLEKAQTDEELAAAQQEIAKARLSVIVAGQDLLDIQNVLTDPTIPTGEEIYQEADDSLEEGNVAIVVATASILDLPDFQLPEAAQPGMPSSGQAGSGSEAETGTGNGGTPGSQSGGFPGSAAGTPGIAGGFPGSHGEQSELDKELSESIAIFEGKILDARNEALGSAPPPTSSENVPGVAVLGGAGTLEGVEGTFEENDQEGLEAGIPEVIEQGRMPEGSDVAKSGEMGSPAIPEDIPDPQGDDIVAKQLRELAIAETEPELKEKLWDEYKKYKAGL